MLFPFLAALLVAASMVKLGALTVLVSVLALALRVVVIVFVAVAVIFLLSKVISKTS